MDGDKFIEATKKVAEFCRNYRTNVRDERVFPDPEKVYPGWLKELLPEEIPSETTTVDDLLTELTTKITPGMTHWHHPRFHAYFPTANSWEAILADMVSSSYGIIGFTWASSPACTELEQIMIDWLAKAIDIPEHFLFSHPGTGGGVIMGSASEATLVSLLAARNRYLGLDRVRSASLSDDLESENDGRGFASDWLAGRMDEPKRNDVYRLAAFCNVEAHSSVERACLLAGVKLIKVKNQNVTTELGLQCQQLEKALNGAAQHNWLPFWVCLTIGTTGTCAVDDIDGCSKVANSFKHPSKEFSERPLWIHVDAAYAGSLRICPELRNPSKQVLEQVDSFNFNPHKWLQVNFDCSAMWFRDAACVNDAFSVDPAYLRHRFNISEEEVVAQQKEIGKWTNNVQESVDIPPNDGAVEAKVHAKAVDYKNWQIPLGRRFRALKLWFVFRLKGITPLQDRVRNDIRLAKIMEVKLRIDVNFEVTDDVRSGLVCFRMKNDDTEEGNKTTKLLLHSIEEEGFLHMVGHEAYGVYRIRFCICSVDTTEQDVDAAYDTIKKHTKLVLDHKTWTSRNK